MITLNNESYDSIGNSVLYHCGIFSDYAGFRFDGSNITVLFHRPDKGDKNTAIKKLSHTEYIITDECINALRKIKYVDDNETINLTRENKDTFGIVLNIDSKCVIEEGIIFKGIFSISDDVFDN